MVLEDPLRTCSRGTADREVKLFPKFEFQVVLENTPYHPREYSRLTAQQSWIALNLDTLVLPKLNLTYFYYKPNLLNTAAQRYTGTNHHHAWDR